jgi:hypothetical protein
MPLLSVSIREAWFKTLCVKPVGPCQRGQADFRFGAKADFVTAEQVAAIGQEETSGALLIECAPDPETDDAVPVAGCSTATISRADLVSKAGPGTAAKAMAAAIACHPRRSIDRCTLVILVQAVLYPLPDVANHVIETEFVWREGADRSGLCEVPPASAASAIGMIVTDVVSPGIGRPRVSARRILVSRACVRLGGAGSGSTRAVASIASLPAANAVASELLL